MNKFKKVLIKILAITELIALSCGICVGCLDGSPSANGVVTTTGNSLIQKINALVDTNQEDFYDSNAIYKNENVTQSQDISVIVTMNTKSLTDAFGLSNNYKQFGEFATSKEAQGITSTIERKRNSLIRQLNASGVSYKLGEKYDTLLSGFEITIKAEDYSKVYGCVSQSGADLIVGEVYEEAATEVIENEVDVYETGIFDTSALKDNQGDGVVVAVLDTGLDYTHTAFDDSPNVFTSTNKVFTLDSISKKIDQTAAAGFTYNLTAEDVYVNSKVPFAYDYADKDPDVAPINSEHGTHVAGIIAGKDDTITGVAPNAQLAIMKVFSDSSQGAKSSWLIAALEDCVTLGVDVINMSLGSGCGFARDEDNQKINDVYNSIRDSGISLIASAANSYNATMGSEKNGNNPLTSNPDSGTVGSPSTYSAALSIASVDGVKTPYILYDKQIIYFTEASAASAEPKDFVDEVLKTVGDNVQSHKFTYVTIPGIGRSSDYLHEDSFYEGKIVLVKRGTLSFEDKVRIALDEKGAAGVIIYNNVSGTISMTIGSSKGAACSISQDEGEMLAKNEIGEILVSRSQVAGPFMSDFSSWGPTSDLQIKPEITAHGGEILSAVPGQDYDRLSGTSMAAPNQAGATALVRQHVKYSGKFGTYQEDLFDTDVTAIVNQLMMSTADIILNKNGLPFAVRKQGAGLVNISNSINTEVYLTTFDKDNNVMDKTKLELGDDKTKSGVYEMSFAINNISNRTASFNVDSTVITEGVSTTYTSHGDTTVSMEGYLLKGTKTTVLSVDNNKANGNMVTVAAGKTAYVTVKIELSEEDKKYLNDSFENGMYVEGFITLKALSEQDVNLNIPLLAFYGDWLQAPIFDEEYYDTNKDEVDAGLDPEDKMMADAYATRVIGGLHTDYIATMGSYYFKQDPSLPQIYARKDHIAMSNQMADGDSNMTIDSIYSINAGLLRNAKKVNISVVEDSTGNTVWTHTEYNQQKSFSSGGSSIYASSIDADFNALANKLKNNTKYTVTVKAYVDYGTEEEQDKANKRNTFTFPLFIDYEAPTVTDVVFRSEYDQTNKKNKLFADLMIYDNHYAMGLQVGQIIPAEKGSGYLVSLSSFGKYLQPVDGAFNSTSKVSFELTDYVAQLKDSVGIKYNADGMPEVGANPNTFTVAVYDYALNSATYEVKLPDEVISMYFKEDKIELSPNQTQRISDILQVYPGESWIESLTFTSSDEDIVDIVNQVIIAKTSGTATITAFGYDYLGNKISKELEVKVLSKDDEGYFGGYSTPSVNDFTITGYTVEKAYYSLSSEEREIGITGSTNAFGKDGLVLNMFPSESVSIEYKLDSYYPDLTEVRFSSGSDAATVEEVVDENGNKRFVITAIGVKNKKTSSAVISADVYYDGMPTFYSEQIRINIKDPFTTNSIYLMSYKGLGGHVEIPGDRGITTIYQYAFSNYDYVDKNLEEGDEINEEDPLYLKPMYIGEDTITSIKIPEGVETIEPYAFAKLTALEEIELPSTLTRIGVGAFYGCESLKKINLKYAKFINENAFANCTSLSSVELDNVVAIGNYAFANCKLEQLYLPLSAQSLGIGAFANNANISSVEFKAPKMKIGTRAFENCTQLSSIKINAAVIAAYAFNGCTQLSDVYLGKDVAVIGEYAFSNTAVEKFSKDPKNKSLVLEEDGGFVVKVTKDLGGNIVDKELVLVAPNYSSSTVTTDATTIGTGAFSGNTKIFEVNANNVKTLKPYAFAGCTNLETVTLDSLEVIGDYAFFNTALKATPKLDKVTTIGKQAFAMTAITSVDIADSTQIGEYAFAFNNKLATVVIGDYVTIGNAAFYNPITFADYNSTNNVQSFNYYNVYYYYVYDDEGNVVESHNYYRYDVLVGAYSNLTSLTIGCDAKIKEYAFCGNARLTEVTLGSGAEIGDYAFFNNSSLKTIDLSGAKAIGNYAFAGTTTQDFLKEDGVFQYAFEKVYVDGKAIIYNYASTSHAAKLESVVLPEIAVIGNGAFAGNVNITEVVFNEAIEVIGDAAFYNNKSLQEVELPASLKKIGANAFYGNALESIDLKNVIEVGNAAFADNFNLKVATMFAIEVEEAEASEEYKERYLGDGAFANNFKLFVVNGLDKALVIGANAFVNTKLTSLTLTEATMIGDFAFAESLVTEVTFGANLVELGENPFAGCQIETFAKVEDDIVDIFGKDQNVGQKTVETYDISKTVKVIGGVLYQVVPNGLELVTYPIASDATNYVVEDNTVRITAKAFYQSNLVNVTLSNSLKAIGDKAFYANEDLRVVVFTSYEAPTLEEEHDESYANPDNLAMTGTYVGYEGLGITKYYMWNVGYGTNHYYFGANFVDHIGHIENKLVMVKPVNGLNYDTFIIGQYFGTVIEGSSAADEVTLNAIAKIAAIPASISLTDEAVIVEARKAYDAIVTVEQQALVKNYQNLTSAEAILAYLKKNQSTSDSEVESESISQSSTNKDKGCGSSATGSVAISLLALAGLTVLRKTANKNNDN